MPQRRRRTQSDSQSDSGNRSQGAQQRNQRAAQRNTSGRDAAQRGDSARRGTSQKSNSRPPSGRLRISPDSASVNNATTVGDARRSIKGAQISGRRQQKSANPSLRRLIVIIIILFVLILTAVIVYLSPAFSVRAVRATGTTYLTDARISNAAAIQSDSTLLRLDVDGIVARLKTDPWIADVSIDRQFPETLVLNITERVPLAKVEILNPQATTGETTTSNSAQWQSTQWLVSADCVWLGLTDALVGKGIAFDFEQAKTVPLISEVKATIEPAEGAEVTDEGISNAIAILDGLSEQMRGIVASAKAPNRAGTTLALTNGVSVAFGAAEDIELKETAIATMLETYAGKLTSINVRVADKPTYRGKL